MDRIRVITLGPLAAKYKRRGLALGKQLLDRPGNRGTSNSVFEGFIIRCTKAGRKVRVTFVAPPGRIVGFNNPVLDPADTYVVSQSPPGEPYAGMTSPDKNVMDPLTSAVTEFGQDPVKPTFRQAMAFGDDMPETTVLYYTGSHPSECEGCVVFPAMYLTSQFAANPGDDNPGWVGWDVRWAGAGRTMSLTMSEAYLESVVGEGFNLGFSPSSLANYYMGARMPVGYVANKKLYGAVQVVNAAVGPIGKLLVFCAEAVDTETAEAEQIMHWQFIIDPAEFSGLAPAPAGSDFWRTAVDLPAIIAWVAADDLGVLRDHCVVTCRIKSEQRFDNGDGLGMRTRCATGQVMVSFLDGVPTVTYDFYDASAGANSGLPVPSPTKAYLQRFPDDLFFGPEGLVRHRKMGVFTRPAMDSYFETLNITIHDDIGYYRTQSTAGTVTQTQSTRGFGVMIENPGDTLSWETTADLTLGFATPVAVGEIWSWGYQNSDKSRITMLVSVNGLEESLGVCPDTFCISTYQREVKNEDGDVVVDMAQLLSYLDGAQPMLAVRKGRAGVTTFYPAPAWSGRGLFYLASVLDTPRYGRIFG